MNQNSDLIPYLHEQYLASGEESLSSSILSMRLLRTTLKMMPNAYMIIDGIDECEVSDRKRILDFFTSVIEHDSVLGQLKVLFVSQDWPDIRKLLQRTLVLKLTESHFKSDIASKYK